MIYRLLADVVVLVHLGFVAFAVAGALLVLRWQWLIWLHVPAATWAALIELAGWICPLTPLENRLRVLGGSEGYRGGFIDHYVLPVLYPSGLTRAVQVFLGGVVVVVNLGVYSFLVARAFRASAERDGGGDGSQ